MSRFLVLATMMLVSATILAGQQTPVPTEEEPHHHVLLKNDYVIVIRATLQPSETTLYHTHSRDTADVELTSSTTTEQLLGKEEGAPATSHAGDVSADSVKKPITHRVRNVGSGPMDIFHVVFVQRPAKSYSHAAAPVAAENASVHVYNWIIAPGGSTPMHRHERPYVIVAATPLRLKMTAPDGRSQSEDVKPGDFHWVESKVTHSLANGGGAQGQIVEIELK